ncbi:SWI SNF related transcriptional regulator ATpase [Cryptosporidium xiaoi]|uniref:SWI SNF related transcriptional regulator ATpase n=1 Tax=Cryptosporidium xiaoi TaxID=659607 RepID=A0AAV9Y1S1_9CRYT
MEFLSKTTIDNDSKANIGNGSIYKENIDLNNLIEDLVYESASKSSEIFARCLDLSFEYKKLKNDVKYKTLKDLEVPNEDLLRYRLKVLVQCYRMLSRGLLPGNFLLGELYKMMDELIVRRPHLFKIYSIDDNKTMENDDSKLKIIDYDNNIFYVMKKYFEYSKLVFGVKMRSYGNFLSEKVDTNCDYNDKLIELVAEVNSFRVNTLEYTGSVVAKNNMYNYWDSYILNEKKILKNLVSLESQRKLRKYISFPADISYKANLHEKLLDISYIQTKTRNDVYSNGQYYSLDPLITEKEFNNVNDNTSDCKEKENNNNNINNNNNNNNKCQHYFEKSKPDMANFEIIDSNIRVGISNRRLLVPTQIKEDDKIIDSIFKSANRKIINFWKSKSPTIQQYKFQLIIENLPIEREKIMQEKRKKRLILSRLAINASKQMVSIQSQKQINMEKKERERLRLLRENDLEAYLELVKETKNRRLQELINQTDRFLIDMGLRVQDQKISSTNNNDSNKFTSTTELKDSLEYNSGLNSKTTVSSYYTMAHTITENITDNPMKLLKGELLPYQVTGVEWMLSLYNNKLHGILADEMGLGKTIQTVALLTYLYEHKENHGPHLVIVPLSTLPNWQKEFEKWSPSLSIMCFKGSRYERRSLFQEIRKMKFNVCLTTFDFIIREGNSLQSIQWKHIIVDEGHRLKNSKSKFHVILHDFNSHNRLLLTGTPLQNNITELWSLLNFLLPQVFHSVEDFQVWFSKPFSELPSNENSLELSEEEKLFIINRLHSILRPFLLRRVKSDVLHDLPEKKEFIVRMELTPWQKIVYDQIKQKAVHSMDLNSGKIQYRSVSNTIIQLRKIVNHPYLFVDEYLIENDDIFRVSCKFEILDRMLPKLIFFKHKVLIFCQMTQLMDILGDFLDYRGIKYHRLDGTMTIQERKERMDEFNSDESDKFVFVLSTRAGGLGLNLQAADTVIIFDSDWNPHQDLQAQSRAHRMGQKNEVRVIRLISISGVEELVLKKAQKKLEIDQKIIQAGMFNSTQVVEDDREDRLRELFGKEEYKSDARVTTPSELNKFMARTENELKTFEEMDKKMFGRSIYNKIYEWSDLVMKKIYNNSESDTLVNENNKDELEHADNCDLNKDLLDFGNNISKSPTKPKRPGRKQKNIQNEQNYNNDEAIEAKNSNRNNEMLTSEDSKVYMNYLEKAGRIISVDEVPDWIVRPPNEVNAELGIDDFNMNEPKEIPRSQRKSRWKSNKDYLCVEGVSERTFLKVVEKYESGEINDIKKELLKETTKRRTSLRRNSTNINDVSSNNITQNKNQNNKAKNKKRKIITFSDDENESNDDFDSQNADVSDDYFETTEYNYNAEDYSNNKINMVRGSKLNKKDKKNKKNNQKSKKSTLFGENLEVYSNESKNSDNSTHYENNIVNKKRTRSNNKLNEYILSSKYIESLPNTPEPQIYKD